MVNYILLLTNTLKFMIVANGGSGVSGSGVVAVKIKILWTRNFHYY